jgi:hypothetical protein
VLDVCPVEEVPVNLPSFTVADGQVSDKLHLAEKALQAGKWDKALAYGVLALAWQQERGFVDREQDEGWPT